MTVLYNLVRVYTNTVGTGTVSLGSAVYGHLSFTDANVQSGDVVSYSIIEGNKVEVGRGTYSATYSMLSRDEVYSSTNDGARINLRGNGQVLITALKEDFDHDTLPNFETDEHIAHSQIDIIAGTGLLGGGDLTSDINLSINQGYQFRWTADQIFEQSVSMLSGLHVGGESPVDFGNLLVEGDLLVEGSTEYNGPTHFGALVTTSKGVHIGGREDPDAPRLQDPNYPIGSLIVEGFTTVRAGLFVSAGASFGGEVSIASNLQVTENANVVGNLYLNGTALLRDSVNILGGLRVGGFESVKEGNLSVKNRLGIGTTFPSDKLHILGGKIRVDPNYLGESRYVVFDSGNIAVENFGGQAIRLGVKDFPTRQIELRTGSESPYGRDPFFSLAVGGDYLDTESKERLRINNAGNLGINNTNPKTKLDIASEDEKDFIRLSLDNTVAWQITPNILGGLSFYSENEEASLLSITPTELLSSTALRIKDNLYIEGTYNTKIGFNTEAKIFTEQGSLELAPDLDLLLAPSSSKVVLEWGTRVQSRHYASDTTGWGISYDGIADFREVRANELKVKTFISDQEQALAGSQSISKSAAPLSRAFVAPLPGTSADLYVTGFEGFPSFSVFGDSDFVRIRVMSRLSDGSVLVADCWGTVTLINIDTKNNEQRYQFVRSASSYEGEIQKSGTMPSGTFVEKGALVLDYGTNNSGFIESTAIG